MIRGVLAVIAGFACWSVLWLGGNAALRAVMPGTFADDGTTTSAGVLVVIAAMSLVVSVVAGWVTGVTARTRPLHHAVALGAVQLVVGIAVQSQYWDRMPLWYHLAFLALLLPGHALGGWLVASREAATA